MRQLNKTIILWLAIACFLFCASVKSQIVFNSYSTGNGSGLTTLTYSKTVAAGNNRLLYVGVTTQNKDISSVKWNNIALTQFTIGTRSGMRVAMYYLVLGSSASPTTANVVVTLAGGSDVFSGAADYSGVWQSPPLQNASVTQAKSTTPNITFSSSTGNIAISLLGDIAATPTANGPGQTQYWTFTGSHSNRSTQKAGAASVTMSHTLSATEDWVLIGATMLDYAVLLPIELSSFSGKQENNKVALKWETASEKNNAYFVIERSSNGLDFYELGRVTGVGTTSQKQCYRFNDSVPLHDTTAYYRLRQVDFDGTGSSSKVIAVKYTTTLSVVVSPNPVADVLSISIKALNTKEANIQVYDSRGTLVYADTAVLRQGKYRHHIHVEGWINGYYTIRVFSQASSEIVYKILVSH